MRRSLAIFYRSLTNRPPADTDGWPSSTRKRRATIPEQTFVVNESGRSVVRPLRLARVVVEDGDLPSIRVGKPKRAASLPSVTGRRPHQREPALAQLLRPGVDLGGGLDPKADLDAISAKLGGTLGPVSTISEEDVRLLVMSNLQARRITQAEADLLQLEVTRLSGKVDELLQAMQ